MKTRENNCDKVEKHSSFLFKLLKGKRLKLSFVVVSECDAQSDVFIDNIVCYLDKQSYKKYCKLSVVIANYREFCMSSHVLSVRSVFVKAINYNHKKQKNM